MLKRGSLVASLLFAAGAFSNAASAADMPGPAPVEVVTDSGWTFAAAPYFWMAGVKGETGQFGFAPISFDASFSDVIKNFDIGFMGAAEARKGRFAVISDVMYAKVGDTVDTQNGILADSISVDTTTFSMLVAGSYRVIDNPEGNLDLLGGARVWSVDTDITLNNSPLAKTFFSDGDTWVDGMVGASGRLFLSPQVYLTGWAMIGAGGSDLTWDVMGGAGYVWSDRVSLVGGYRALSVDYTNGDFVYDVVQQGPFLGARISF